METAYLLISCEIGWENKIASLLRKMKEINDVLVTYGNYDIVAKICAKDKTHLDRFIATQIRKLEKIRSTVTLNVYA